MWIEKTPNEIELDNKKGRENIFIYILIFLGIFSFDLLCTKYIGDNHRFQMAPPTGPLTWTEAYTLIPGIIIVSLLLTISIFIFKRQYNRYQEKERNKTFICMKCNKMTKLPSSNQCECGGQYSNVTKLKWIDK